MSEGAGNSGRTRGSTGGLRERKRSLHEGVFVLGIARWLQQISVGEETTPIIGSDLFSTILGIVDMPLPTDRTIDGTNLTRPFRASC